jgi:hypothetical protein
LVKVSGVAYSVSDESKRSVHEHATLAGVLLNSSFATRESAATPWERERLRAQMLRPALAEIIGARRLWTVSMISAVSIPSR